MADFIRAKKKLAKELRLYTQLSMLSFDLQIINTVTFK